MTLQDQKELTKVKSVPYIIRDDYHAMKPQEPINYLIENLITNASVNVFYGEPGSKKTYSLLSMAVAVANGKDWLGFKTKKSSVLFIDEESGEKRFSRRLNETIQGEDCQPNGNIKYISLGGFKLDRDICVQTLKKEIENNKIRLVIIDALAEIMDGDENSKKDVQPIMAALRKIADNTNCSIILIHHSNKGGGYRGSSVIKAASDLMIQVVSLPDKDIIDFYIDKNRDGKFPNFSAKACWNNDKFKLSHYENQEKLSPKEQYIINYLFTHGESYTNDIIKDVTICKPDQLRKSIFPLVKKNKIYCVNPNEKTNGAIYALV